MFSKPRCNKTQLSYRTAICVVTGRATLVVNSASNYASGSLEPPSGSITAARGLTSSVCSSTFGLHQTTASVLSSLLPGYHTGSSQTGCDCLAAHDSHPFGSPPTAFPYKWAGLRQGAQPSGYRVWSFPQNTARTASRLSPKCCPTSTGRMRYRIPSDPAPGHQLAARYLRRDTRAVSHTARG